MNQIKRNVRFTLFSIISLFSFIIPSIQADNSATIRIAGQTIQYAPDQILVRFKPGVSAASKAIAYGENPPIAIHSFKSLSGLAMLTLPAGVDVETAIKQYKSNPNVLYAEPNHIVNIAATNDTSFIQLWGLNNTGQNINGTIGTVDADMNIVEAWSNSNVTGSNSVVIAVIDTGVQYTHPDLAANMWTNPGEIAGNNIDDDGNGYVDDVYGINAITNSGNPMDDNNHGTHVAGTIAAVGENSQGITGVNQQAKILACKFLNSAGSGTDSNALKCLDYIYSLKMSGINIVVSNNSWGGTGGGSQAISDVIELHRNAGILFVAAAGNSSINNDISPHYPSSYYQSNVISVAATDQNDAQASFSNYGRRSVHIGAPGVNIYSSITGNGYTHFQGTSMAAPHVAGLAALLSAEDPARDWITIKNLIISSGTPTAALSASTNTGRRVRAWDSDGTGAMTCSNQSVASVVYPHVSSSTKIGGTKLGLAAMNLNCAVPAGNVTITTTGPAAVAILTLLDDGFEFDDVAGDGIYSAYWTAPATTGTYTLTFSNGQTQTVSVIANTSTLQSYRTPVEIAYSPRADAYGYTQIPDNGYISLSGYTSYFQLPIGGVNGSVIYAIPQGANLLSAPTGSQLTGANTTIPADLFETLIAGYWDDLDLYTAGYGIKAWFFYNSGLTPVGEAIFEWKGRHKTTGNPVQFQIIYTANSSDIEMHYISTDNSAESATVGIQVDWVRASSQSYNIVNPDLATGKAWKWSLDTGAPTVNAGIDQNVAGNVLATLSGTATDPDGGVLTYNWAQTAGTIVTLNNANTLTPNFYAPNTTETLTFILTATDDSGQSASNTMNINITAGGSAGSLQFDSVTYSVNENAGMATIAVTRTGGTGGVVGLSYATGDSSAFAPGDYTYQSGSLSWSNGDGTSKTFSIPINDDSDVEGNETLSLFLLNETGGATLGVKNATLSIIDNDVPGTIAFSVATYSVNENGVTAMITAKRTQGTSGVVGVSYATANGSALTVSDYTASSGTLSWANGDSADKTFTVSIVNDSVAEPDETVSLALSNVTGGATLGTANATLSIVDNDNAGVIAFNSATYSVNENATFATITVSRTIGFDGSVSIDYLTADVTALNSSDYTASSGTLNWADADSSDKTFTVAITDDNTIEGNETLSVALSHILGGAVLGNNAATLTIVDNDIAANGSLSFTSSSYSVNENGGSITISVSRTGGSDGVVSVNYTSADITANNNDYAAVSGTLTWANADSANKTFTVNIIDDSNFGSDETVSLAMSGETGGASLGTSSAVLTIVENDVANMGIISLSASTYRVNENDASLTVTVTRTQGSDGSVSIGYSSADVSALAGSDYVQTSGTLSWLDGDIADKTFAIPLIDDVIYEGDETLSINLSDVTGGVTIGTDTSIITISENDTFLPGILSFVDSSVSLTESVSTIILSVSRTGGSDGDVSVVFASVNASAIAGEDYTAVSGTLNWVDGDTSNKTIVINITNDTLVENDETFAIGLSGASIINNATSNVNLAIANADVTITITDDDVAVDPTPVNVGTISLLSNSYTVDEGNVSALITIERLDGSDGAISVNYNISEGSATLDSDFTMTSGIISWADGDATAKIFTIIILDDWINEANETIFINLSNIVGGASIGTMDATLTITDNDAITIPDVPVTPVAPVLEAGTLSLSSATYLISEADGIATINVTRSNGSAGIVSIDYVVSAGTATLDSDFIVAVGTLNWADNDSLNQSFSIEVLDDVIFEGDETILISLSNATGGASLATIDATLTITDDEVEPVAANQPPEAPILISPVNGSTGVNAALVTFNWNMVTDPEGDAVNYSLEYCVNMDFSNCSGQNKGESDAIIAKIEMDSSTLITGIGGGAGVGIALLGLMGSVTRRQRILQVAAIIVLSLIISACGTTAPVDNGDGTMSQVKTNLQSNTTYYWKVTATDTNDLSATSEVWSFTTL